MRCVQRARLAREEALREIVRVPEIEIADLRALDADDAKDVSGRRAEGARLPRRDDGFRDFCEVTPHGFVKRAVIGRELVDGVADDRACGAALRGIGRGSDFGLHWQLAPSSPAFCRASR